MWMNPISHTLFSGNGEMATLMRSLDWSQTPLGPVESWPQSLRTAVSICLNSRFPMVIWWSQDLVLLYNDAWLPILGTKHPQALGRPGREAWAEIWDIIGAQLNGVLTSGQATWSDDLLLSVERYGYVEEAYFTYSYSPIFLETGEVGGAFTAVTETTRRVIGERRLSTLRELAANSVAAKSVQESCQIASATLANNPYDIPFALLYLIEPEGEQARLAGAAGLEMGTVASPERIDLSPAKGSNHLSCRKDWNLSDVARTGETLILPDLIDRFGHLPGGAWDERPESAVILPLTHSGQKQQLAGFLILGVSPRRKLDDEYQGFFDLVANHVTTAIANATVYEEERQRAEALAELDRAKTTFFSNVSHEFRTPLTLMLGPLEDLLQHRSESLPIDVHEQIETIHRNSLRLLKLVNTLLDFSRIEAGRVQAVYEPTDLAELTTDLAGVFRSAIERAGLRLIVDCPSLPQPIYIDRGMWEKIVLNLLSNAFKFTFEGEISVALVWQAEQVKLTVRDTGIGISEEELPRLFERFHRVPEAQGRTFEGSGIGLSLVQELVKLHGGQIQVDSTIGQGTRFVVSIPTGSAHLPSDRIGGSRNLASTAISAASFVEEALRWQPEDQLRDTEQRSRDEVEAIEIGLSSSPQLFLPLFPTARILLADDNADMRNYVKRLLGQQYEVEAVADGVAALEAIRQRLPDLVLTDVMMPKLDGFGVLRELRSHPATREIPVILLSARAGEESRVEGLEAGADDYLIKPFSARELLARVEASLKMVRVRQEALQREQALRVETEAAREDLASVLARIGDQFLALDHQWRYTYVNEQVCQTIGRPKAEILGQNIWDLFPDLIGSRFYREVHRAFGEQKPIQFEYYYSNWQRWFENRVYPSSDGVSIFVTDITDRKLAEEALQQSELNFRTLADTMPQMFWTTRPDGYHEYFNQRWYEYTGLTLEDTQGWGWSHLLHPEDCQRALEVWNESLRTGKDYTIEYRFRRAKDGQYRWFLGQAFPLRDENGQIIRWFGSCTDIHDQKSLLEERDQALERERIAREQAETANRIKDEFLAVLSHELRSPLNPILGWTRLLQTRKFDELATKRALETIERNAKLQTQLIEDLLDVSRILRGKMILNVVPVDLITVIEAALETVRLSAEAKGIQIHKVLKPEVGLISGDSSRLQQIIWNLLSNAIKFTPAGGQVTVCLERVGSLAQIQVRDTGKGIKPEFLPHVFEYFRQEDGSTTRTFGGLGLGLAIVRHLTELHGGTIHAASPGEDQGATFTVQLPLLQQAQPQRNPETWGDADSLMAPSSEPLSGLRILVVDDEADMRELTALILEQSGAEVSVTTSAAEALSTLEAFKPNVLISDIGMPEIDGYMLMRQAKQQCAKQGRPLLAIALTAYAGATDQQQALAAGFDQHIAKPIEPMKLVEAVLQLSQG